MVVPIGASTAGDRDIGGEFWEKMLSRKNLKILILIKKFFTENGNEKSLEAIQKALFVVCLDIDQKMERVDESKVFKYFCFWEDFILLFWITEIL